MKLTIGMASYNNYQEVWFTVQSLIMYHDLTDCEILVVDNYGDDNLKKFMENWAGQRYVKYVDKQGPSHAKNKVFEEASGGWVICIDSHVLLHPKVIERLKMWIDCNQDSSDLFQGPLVYDNMRDMADSMNDEWRGNMWGTWHGNKVADDVPPYEIQMQGCGLMVCRKEAWQGFNPDFKGFGGEEGYIHQKFRNAGHKTMCLPWMKWTHKFATPGKIPFTPILEDRVHNYDLGLSELGIDKTAFRDHFKTK